MFCWDVLGTLLGVNGEKWRLWYGLEVVAVSEGGRANAVVIPALEY